MDNLLVYLERAMRDEKDTIRMLTALKSSPSILGDEVLIEDHRVFDSLPRTKAQDALLGHPLVDPQSDMVDHIVTYDDEECAWVMRALEVLDGLTDAEVRDEARIREVLPEVNLYNKIEGAGWDPRKRDTVIQIRCKMSRTKPKRLVQAPLSIVRDSLAVLVRHVGKPFQGAHVTTTDVQRVLPFMDMCDEFILTVWVGPMGGKITQSGTGFRSSHFPGGPSPDHVNRILIRNLTGPALHDAHADFVKAYSATLQKDHTVPLLLQLQDFVLLHP